METLQFGTTIRQRSMKLRRQDASRESPPLVGRARIIRQRVAQSRHLDEIQSTEIEH